MIRKLGWMTAAAVMAFAVAGTLQKSGLIKYHRGRVTVVDQPSTMWRSRVVCFRRNIVVGQLTLGRVRSSGETRLTSADLRSHLRELALKNEATNARSLAFSATFV